MSALQAFSELARADAPLDAEDAARLVGILGELVLDRGLPQTLVDTLGLQAALLKRGAPEPREQAQLRCSLRELEALRIARELPSWVSAPKRPEAPRPPPPRMHREAFEALRQAAAREQESGAWGAGEWLLLGAAGLAAFAVVAPAVAALGAAAGAAVGGGLLGKAAEITTTTALQEGAPRLLEEQLEGHQPPSPRGIVAAWEKAAGQRLPSSWSDMEQVQSELARSWAHTSERHAEERRVYEAALKTHKRVRDRYKAAAQALDRAVPPHELGNRIELDSTEGADLGLLLGGVMAATGLVMAPLHMGMLIVGVCGGAIFGLAARRKRRVQEVHRIEAAIQRWKSRETGAMTALRFYRDQVLGPSWKG